MGKPINIDAEFEKLLTPLAAEEFAELEKQILKEGCRHKLVIWKEENILIDGHNRYKICKKHGKPYEPYYMKFSNRDEVVLWIIKNQLARRNLTDFQRGDLVLKKESLISSRSNQGVRTDLFPNLEKGSGLNTLKEMARMADMSSASLAKVKKIKAKAAPAVLDAVSKDEIAIDVAANLAMLPKEEQDRLAAEGVQAMKAAAKATRAANKVKSAKAKSPVREIKQDTQTIPVADITNNDDAALDTINPHVAADAPAEAESLAPSTGESTAVAAAVNADNLPEVQAQEEDYRRLSEDLQVLLDQCRKEQDVVLKENAALRSENEALRLELEALRLQLQAPQEDVACAAA